MPCIIAWRNSQTHVMGGCSHASGCSLIPHMQTSIRTLPHINRSVRARVIELRSVADEMCAAHDGALQSITHNTQQHSALKSQTSLANTSTPKSAGPMRARTPLSHIPLSSPLLKVHSGRGRAFLRSDMMMGRCMCACMCVCV